MKLKILICGLICLSLLLSVLIIYKPNKKVDVSSSLSASRRKLVENGNSISGNLAGSSSNDSGNNSNSISNSSKSAASNSVENNDLLTDDYKSVPIGTLLAGLNPGSLTRYTNPTGTLNKQFINGLWSWYGDGSNDISYNNYIDVNISRGCSAITYNIDWSDVEKVKGQFDFSVYDKRLDYAINKGLKIFLRVSTRVVPTWIPDSYFMKDFEGNIITENNVGVNNDIHLLSYANMEAMKLVQNYWDKVVERYQNRYKSHATNKNPILSYMTMFNPTAEFEFSISQNSDYSDSSKSEFILYCKNTYGDIALLNERWKTSYSSFNDIKSPNMNSEPNQSYLADYMMFRNLVQKRVTDMLAEVVHKQNGAKIGIVFGSIWDSIVRNRNTLFVDYWMENVDWLHTADAPNYNFKFSIDVSRGIASGKPFTNEIDGKAHPAATPERYNNQSTISFERGAAGLFVANWYSAEFADTTSLFRFITNTATVLKISPKVKQVTTKKAIYSSTSTLIQLDGNILNNKTKSLWEEVTDYGTELVDIIRDGNFVNSNYALNQYTDIYIDYNTYISDEARAALIRFKKSGGNLHIVAPIFAGLKNLYNNERENLLVESSDNIKPVAKIGTANNSTLSTKEYIVGIADDNLSGVAFVQYSFDNGKVWYKAKGCSNFQIGLINFNKGKQTVKIRAYDNNANVSEEKSITITVN